jgi:protease II
MSILILPVCSLAAAVHRRPELFRGVILKVPFLDVLTAMLDETLPLTQHEYDEWGNPREDSVAYECIRQYSPYETIGNMARHFPHVPSMLLTSSLRDQRVPFWQPLKYIARLRQCTQQVALDQHRKGPLTDEHPMDGDVANAIKCLSTPFSGYLTPPIFLLNTSKTAGHFGQGGRYAYLEEAAYEYAFLLGVLENKFKGC